MSKNPEKDFLEYMKAHNLEGLFETLTASLLKNKPKDPLEFLAAQLNEYKKSGYTSETRKVVFVLGGPGSGKGTQCARLVEECGMIHYSAGDLLREEAKLDTEEGKMISTFIKEGLIVPGEITIRLLKKAIFSNAKKDAYFLIDGFPREMKQALDFEREVCPCQFVLFFDCPMEVLEKRLLLRGATSGRVDDNIESIKKRFITYQNQTMPVIEYFGAKGKVRKIDSSQPIQEVANTVKKTFDENEKQQKEVQM